MNGVQLTPRPVERVENIIRGDVLPVATGGFDDIEIHPPQAAHAVAQMLQETPDEGAEQ